MHLTKVNDSATAATVFPASAEETGVPAMDPTPAMIAAGRAVFQDWIVAGGFEVTPVVDRMLRDAGHYLPALLGSEYVDSLFEVKTVLVNNEHDDGRPILFEKHPELPGCYSVLGGKIDNIFDVIEKLDAEQFVGVDAHGRAKAGGMHD